MPVKFTLPNSLDPFSLKPGAIPMLISNNKASDLEKSASLTSAIAGARAAATQFTKKGQNILANSIQHSHANSKGSGQPDSKSLEEGKIVQNNSCEVSCEQSSVSNKPEKSSHIQYDESSNHAQTREDRKQLPGASAKVLFLTEH